MGRESHMKNSIEWNKISLFRKSSILFYFLVMVSLLSFSSPLTAKEKTPNMTSVKMIFQPILNQESGSITHLLVQIELKPNKEAAKKHLVLRASSRYASALGAADRIESLRAYDQNGSLNLEPEVDITEYDGMVVWKRWKSSRLPSGKITVSYLAKIPEPKPRRGPPFELSVQGGGISGAGCGFLAFPELQGKFELEFRWNLQNLEPDSKGLSTIGDGDFTTTINVEEIFSCFFIAGPVGLYPEKGEINGFKCAWLGNPTFNAREIAAWTAKAFNAIRSYFHSTDPAKYRFFMIAGPENMGIGGTGLQNSFMLFVPTDPQLADDPRGTIVHEMTHYWVGGMEGDAATNFWFTEGLTVHYTRLVPYRIGLFTPQEYLDDVNRTVYRHITNPRKNLPNDRIGGLFWQERNVQIIPYDRGSLYFAYLDGKIRKNSNGRRSLDNLIFELFEERKKGKPLSQERWLEKIQEELGSLAREEFKRIIIEGQDFMPDSEAFGEEFERIPITVHQFELGFDERVFSTKEKIITGLVKGSQAERAGLQDGDQILNNVNLNVLRDSEKAHLRLRIKRGEKIKEIEYWPRGKSLLGYKWIPKSELSWIPFIKMERATVNGRSINYSILIEEFPVSDGLEGPTARIVSTSYIVSENGEDLNRPVIFIFNGGPIVPSFYLHVGAFGPKRVSFTEDICADPDHLSLIDNKYTVLDIADLVFFDPAGTGWSRVIEGNNDAYFSVEADSRQLTQFILAWCQHHKRLNSPKYIFGESYGTLRAAAAAQKLIQFDSQFRIDGIFLLGQALNIVETVSRPQNIISYVVSLPTLASLAWYHGLIDKKGRTFEKFLDEVRYFARTEYLTALFQGNKLDSSEKKRLAFRLSEFTGLPADFYYANNLRVNKYQFRFELLKNKNEVLGLTDGRYKTKIKEKGEVPDPAEVINIALKKGFQEYLKKSLGLDQVEKYVLDSPVKNLEEWKWGATSPFGDWPYMSPIKEVMEKRPDLKVFLGVGYYDLQTTIGATEYAISQSGWPSNRVKVCYYHGGHMPYSSEQSLKAIMADVRALLGSSN